MREFTFTSAQMHVNPVTAMISRPSNRHIAYILCDVQRLLFLNTKVGAMNLCVLLLILQLKRMTILLSGWTHRIQHERVFNFTSML